MKSFLKTLIQLKFVVKKACLLIQQKKKCKFSFVKTDAKTRGGMGLWLSSENGEHTIKFEDSMLMVSCS